MQETKQYTILCPCCEATILIDAHTGTIISSQEKAKPTTSFDEMKKELDRQKEMRNQIFAQGLGSEKDRGRILEEKFREAFKNADKDDDKPFKNPLDLG